MGPLSIVNGPQFGRVLLKVHLTSIDCSAVSHVRVAAMDEIPSAVIIFRLSNKGRGQVGALRVKFLSPRRHQWDKQAGVTREAFDSTDEAIQHGTGKKVVVTIGTGKEGVEIGLPGVYPVCICVCRCSVG
jgi:hypothetical protein